MKKKQNKFIQEVTKSVILPKSITEPRVVRWYQIFAVAMLLITTSIWSFVGAKIHEGNSDQIVNTYLFENWSTFHNAQFPAAHSFLIKWPVFLLVKLLGTSSTAFTVVTVLISLATVAGLAYIIYRIDRRPIIFGTICLAMASVLLLVPPQPYPGGILPVNMAMIATRNLEYIVYIASLFLLVRSSKLRNRSFWLAIVVLAVLGASDRLFLTFSVGGAVIACGVYVFTRKKALLRVAKKWVILSVLSALLALGIIAAINLSRVTNIAGKFDSGPYGAIHSTKQLELGSTYAVLGIATNFGANPVFDAQVVSKIPTLAREKLLSPAGVTYVVNFGIMVFGIYVAFRLFAASFRWRKNKRVDNPSLVSILLIWSSFASIGAFIVTDHYYVVDARYLAIVLFAVSVAATTYLRDKIPLSNKKMLWLIIVLTTSILFGFVSLFQTRNADSLALSDVEGRNELIAQALAKHRVDALVGDYWRVMPIKLETHGSVQILPLDSCIAPRKILSSSNWQVPLSQHSFAYILSLDASLTNYSKCTLDQIIAEYGQPNQSVLIGGSLNKPKEFVLFYDNGAQKSTLQPRTPQDKTSTVLPIALTDLLNTDCPDSITVMNIVAHQDDDLLFMNPDLEHNIMAGNCVRTVYVTAGDAGRPTQYWQAREAASEAAYNSLLGINNIWVHRIVKISDTEFLTVANPKDNYKISLIFMLLPDGNISGQGFRVTNHESLASLKAHRITLIHSVDKQSVYSSDGLVSALAEIMKTYKPSELHIQAPQNDGKFTADHSDHKSVGSYTDHAMKLYVSNHAVTTRYYVGYSGREWPQNVFGEDLSKKTNAFLEYAKHDNAVCQTLEECKKLRSYGSYLPRQYSFPR